MHEKDEMKVKTNGICLHQTKLLNSIRILNKTLERYNDTEMFLSFNGGKDCTVLLHLIINLFVKKYPDKKLLCLYIQPMDPFDEIEKFIKDCQMQYNIVVETIQGTVKGALFEVCKRHPELKVCIMGCRRTDPYCGHLNEFQETDSGWPPLIRVNPLLDWTCKDIWDYLHKHNVSYCPLYRFGYTSVGDKTNTLPNPYLKRENVITGKDEYLHADQLINMDHLERAGRR